MTLLSQPLITPDAQSFSSSVLQGTTSLHAASSALSAWLREKALPFWIRRGYCTSEKRFIEGLCEEDLPQPVNLNRARIQPRQIYTFTSALLRGCPHTSPEMITNSYVWFTTRYRLPDGTFGNLVDAQGVLVDPTFDLYNQAFAILMFAQMAQFQPQKQALFESEAAALLAVIQEKYSNENGGYNSGPAAQGFLESNPHMHLFEAALAWEAVAENKAVWRALADEIGTLALQRMIDPESKALGEFFNPDWSPAFGAGREVIEPGHQFEWAWLLTRWAKRCELPQAKKAARDLFDFGRTHGITDQGLIVMSLNRDTSFLDPTARMWPQLEWLKAATILALDPTISSQYDFVAEVSLALKAVSAFWAEKGNGSWVDRIDLAGQVCDGKAPASTFYHIICAIYELEDALDQLLKLDGV